MRRRSFPTGEADGRERTAACEEAVCRPSVMPMKARPSTKR